MRTCTVEGCGKPYRASGYCGSHYANWYETGDPIPKRDRRPTECSECGNPVRAKGLCSRHYYEHRRAIADPCVVEGCDRVQTALGLCKAHYKRQRVRGSTAAASGDRGGIVERLDARSRPDPSGCIIWTDPPNSSKGYGRIRWGDPDPETGRKKYWLAHRVAWALWNDVEPADMSDDLVRHTCNNALCINPLHLALGTHSENALDSVRAGTHAVGKLTHRVGVRLRQVAIRKGVAPELIDEIITELKA